MNKAFILSIFISLALAGCQSSKEPVGAAAGNECAHCAGASESSVDDSLDTTYASEWLPESKRGKAVSLPLFENQAGRQVTTEDLRGAPVALSFIYTRCENQRKCPLVARTMAELQKEVQQAKITPHPRLALVTYDPEYDTPKQLKAFGKTHGVHFTDTAMLLRPEADRKEQLFKDLNVRVNFNERGVNLHGVQLILLDKQGRFVRAYHTLIWSNDKVLADLKRLASE